MHSNILSFICVILCFFSKILTKLIMFTKNSCFLQIGGIIKVIKRAFLLDYSDCGGFLRGNMSCNLFSYVERPDCNRAFFCFRFTPTRNNPKVV